MAVKEVSKSRSVTTLRSGAVRLWLEVESSQNGVLYIHMLPFRWSSIYNEVLIVQPF